MKYRKKPVVIEAFKMGIDPRPDWFTDKVNAGEIVTHAVEGQESGSPFHFQPTYCEINTLEGVMRGDYGDYIIKGIQGEIYPCKPDIFAATYEPVEAGKTERLLCDGTLPTSRCHANNGGECMNPFPCGYQIKEHQ